MLPWVTVFKRFPIVQKFKPYFVSKEAIAARKTHLDYSRNKIVKCVSPFQIGE